MGHNTARRSLVTLVAAGVVAATIPAQAVQAAPPRDWWGSATRITLYKTGGIAGVDESYVVDKYAVGGERALRLAGSWQFRWLRGSYKAKKTMSDRFEYKVSVRYRGGDRKTVSTVDGAKAPEVLWQVIKLSERYGNRPMPMPATP